MRPERTTDRLLATEPQSFGPLQNYYVLEPTPCPYLPGRRERKLLTEISGPQAQRTYEALTLAGFRRSHRFAYRPACTHCNACTPVRVVRSEEHTSELQSLMRISYAVFCLKKKTHLTHTTTAHHNI